MFLPDMTEKLLQASEANMRRTSLFNNDSIFWKKKNLTCLLRKIPKLHEYRSGIRCPMQQIPKNKIRGFNKIFKYI